MRGRSAWMLVALAACRSQADSSASDAIDAGPLPTMVIPSAPPAPPPQAIAPLFQMGAADTSSAGTDNAPAPSAAAAPQGPPKFDVKGPLVGYFEKAIFRPSIALVRDGQITIYESRAGCDSPPLGRMIYVAADPWAVNATKSFRSVMGAMQTGGRVELSGSQAKIDGKAVYWGNYAAVMELNSPTMMGSTWRIFEDLTGTVTFGKKPVRGTPGSITVDASSKVGRVAGKVDVYACK